MKVLLFGDSNTWGFVPFGGRYSEEERYSYVLKEAGYEVYEDGVCGRTTIFPDRRPGLLGYDSLEDALDKNYDFICVMLGSNDFKTQNAVTKDKLIYALDKFYSRLDSLNKGARVILISPPLLSKNIGDIDYEYSYESYEISLEASSIYEEFARNRGYLFLDAAKYTEPGIDGCHITPESHIKLGKALKNLIEKSSN